MTDRNQPDQTHDPRMGKARTSIHLVLNWTHMSVFIAVATLGIAVATFGLITLNQGFAGIDRRFDDVNRRLGRVETRLDRVEGELSDMKGELSDMNARLSVVEFIGIAGVGAGAESPSTAEVSTPDC